MKHFLSLKDYNKNEIEEILNLAIKLKADKKRGVFEPILKNKSMAMIFMKNSTRTRLSCEIAMFELGGHGIYLNSSDTQMSRGESIRDSAKVMSSMVDFVSIRTYKQSDIEEFAKYSTVPVINTLSDSYHPTQLIADLLTIKEQFNHLDNLYDLKIAYIGDGNNMAHSYLMLCSIMGFDISIATPKGYEVDSEILKIAQDFAKQSNSKISITNNAKEATKDANVVVSDTWISMGQEEEKAQKLKDFKGFMVDDDVMGVAKKDAIFLHCMPAYKGYEVSSEVYDRFEDIIIQEAENRLHAQKAILCYLNNTK